MERKAVGPVCCGIHVIEPSYTYHVEKGFVRMLLAVAAECAIACSKPFEGAS